MSQGVKPGDPGYDEFVRNGFAAGIEGLWVTGYITTAKMVDELNKLLEQGPAPKAEQVLRRLGQHTQ
jgi:hypothetical protein